MQGWTNDAVIERWGAFPRAMLESMEPEGDFAKRHLLNPVLLRMLGDVRGRRVLDAGCGHGYLARMLAVRGAQVTGFEQLAPSWRAHGEFRTREYFAEYEIPEPYTPDFHRPLSAYLNELARLGCQLRELAEPALDPATDTSGQPGAEAYMHLPNFLVVAARAPADPAGKLLRLTCNNNLLPRSVRFMDRAGLSRIGGALTPREWVHATGMAAVVIGLHVVGWVTLLAVVVPGHYSIGTQAFGAGIGVTAYTLGARHAFDADHISAIDNTTRKLMADGKRPLSVGFFFSLGHSTVVFVLALLLSLGMRAIVGPVRNDGSALHQVTNLVGTGVSGTFLYLIAAINLVVLAGILKVFRELRQGRFDEQALEARLNERGFVNRLFGNLMRSIRRPGQMYGVGLLFGLGFDTATEVTLLVLAGSGAASGLPWYAILCLPVLFAAGMSLLDTIDGSFMNFAYGWAFSNPVRKVYYNITITALSVVVALLIGTVELAGLLGQQLSLGGPFWTWVEGLNINTLGFFIVGLFVVTWAFAMIAWRAFRIEQRFGSRARRPRELPEAVE